MENDTSKKYKSVNKKSATAEFITDLFLFIRIIPLKIIYKKQHRQIQRNYDKTIPKLIGYLKYFSKPGYESIKNIINFALYLNLLTSDLDLYINNLLYSFKKRERFFVLKHLVLLIYETTEDLTQLLGKDFRAAVADLECQELLVSEINGVSKTINDFWKQNQEPLQDIRIINVAHRDHDAQKYLDTLMKINQIEILKLTTTLNSLINQLIIVLTKVLDNGLRPDVSLKQFLKTLSNK